MGLDLCQNLRLKFLPLLGSPTTASVFRVKHSFAIGGINFKTTSEWSLTFDRSFCGLCLRQTRTKNSPHQILTSVKRRRLEFHGVGTNCCQPLVAMHTCVHVQPNLLGFACFLSVGFSEFGLEPHSLCECINKHESHTVGSFVDK